MRKVLIIAYYFPPLAGGGTQRVLKFCQHLPKLGWQPVVLTVRDCHHVLQDVTLAAQLDENVAVRRTRALLPARFFRRRLDHQAGDGPTLAGKKDSALKRVFVFGKNLFYTLAFVPDEFIGWYPFAVSAARDLIRRERIEVILSSSPPNTVHVIARALHKRTGLPWIADLRDLWDMYPDSYNPLHWRWRARLDEKLARCTLRSANRLVVASPGMHQHLLQKGRWPDGEKIVTITNGFDPMDFAGIAPHFAADKFTIVHAGSLFPWRSLQPFLQALHLLFAAHPKYRSLLRLKLLGVVPETEKSAISAVGVRENVESFGYLSFRENVAHLLGADLLLLLVGDIPHAPEMIPGKLFDYLGAGRPILAIGPGGSARQLVRQENLGWDFDPDASAAIADRLARELTRWQQQKPTGRALTRGAPSPQYKKFQRFTLTEQLVEIIESLASGKHAVAGANDGFANAQKR